MANISGLFIYPIKSLGGIALTSSRITARGLEHDRRWMLVDEKNEFLTQRVYPAMALLKTGIEDNSITVFHSDDPQDMIRLPLQPPPSETISVKIWNDECRAQYADDDINNWFSQKLKIPCRAVYMPESTERKLDPGYAKSEEDITGFSDGYPILLISEASLADLNERLAQPVPMDRFRPNIVISGTLPFAEDTMKEFRINDTVFYGVKLCGRCVVTTIDQQNAEKTKEPLKTLASFRTINNKVCFGQNVISSGSGEIRNGDEIEIVAEGPVGIHATAS